MLRFALVAATVGPPFVAASRSAILTSPLGFAVGFVAADPPFGRAAVSSVDFAPATVAPSRARRSAPKFASAFYSAGILAGSCILIAASFSPVRPTIRISLPFIARDFLP
jgi:hypothetical protein